MQSVRIALAAGLTITVLAIGVVLSGAPSSLAGTNAISADANLGGTNQSSSVCQGNEVLPSGTSAIRLTLVAEIGPKVTVAARSGGQVLTHGTRGSGWTGGTVTIPVTRVSRTTSDVDICATLGRPVETIRVFGQRTPKALALTANGGQKLLGRMGIEYLRSGHASWLSLLPMIARRMGLGHAWGGTWIVFFLLGAMASGVTLTSWLILRELR